MNEQDKELLKFAAKAIGYDLHINLAGAAQLWRDGEYASFWDPLKYDLDALRLVAELRIYIYYDQQKQNLNAPSLTRYINAIAEDCYIGALEPEGTDPHAATRRAIVRAAAEVGRKLGGEAG